MHDRRQGLKSLAIERAEVGCDLTAEGFGRARPGAVRMASERIERRAEGDCEATKGTRLGFGSALLDALDRLDVDVGALGEPLLGHPLRAP